MTQEIVFVFLLALLAGGMAVSALVLISQIQTNISNILATMKKMVEMTEIHNAAIKKFMRKAQP